MLLYFSLLILAIVFFFFYRRHLSNVKWHKKPLRNFPFMYRGKEFWYSRSVAVTHFVFCKNASGNWCVLANKRGNGTPDFQGYWNCPCGYLDFDESAVESAQRETFEETNVYIKKNNINFYAVDTSPRLNKQNVSIHYYSKLDGRCEDFVLTDESSEKNEIDEIKWIEISEVDNYKWAFNHSQLIKDIFNNLNN